MAKSTLELAHTASPTRPANNTPQDKEDGLETKAIDVSTSPTDEHTIPKPPPWAERLHQSRLRREAARLLHRPEAMTTLPTTQAAMWPHQAAERALLAHLAEEQKWLAALARQKERGRAAAEAAAAAAATGRAMACLRCATWGLRCSLVGAQWEGEEREVRCARCMRSGAEICVQQARDLDVLREEEGKGVVVEEAATMIALLGPAKERVAVFAREAGVAVAQVRDVAEDILQGEARSVCGLLLGRRVRANLAVPIWHKNDQPQNRNDPDYVVQSWQRFFAEKRAQEKGTEKEIVEWMATELSELQNSARDSSGCSVTV